MEPVTATLIGTGVAAAAAGGNMAFQGSMNKKTRRFAEKMYRQQYADELAFWRMNNAYNHPSAQMERLRNAGLNPHLVYGNGTVGNSSSAPSAPSQPRWQGKAPQFDPGIPMQGLETMYNLQAVKAQTDNVRAQNTLIRQEALLKNLEMLKKTFDLDVDYATKEAIIGKAFAEWEKLGAETDLLISRDKEQDVKNFIAALTAQDKILEAKLSNELKQKGIDISEVREKILDAQALLWDKGINPNDPTALRMLVTLLEKLIPGFGELLPNY